MLPCRAACPATQFQQALRCTRTWSTSMHPPLCTPNQLAEPSPPPTPHPLRPTFQPLLLPGAQAGDPGVRLPAGRGRHRHRGAAQRAALAGEHPAGAAGGGLRPWGAGRGFGWGGAGGGAEAGAGQPARAERGGAGRAGQVRGGRGTRMGSVGSAGWAEVGIGGVGGGGGGQRCCCRS